MLEMILAEQSCLSTGCVSTIGSYSSAQTQNSGTTPLFWFKSFSPLSPRISDSDLSCKSVLDELFGDEPFGDELFGDDHFRETLSERKISTVARNYTVKIYTVIADFLKRGKGPRLQRNETTGSAVLSNEDPTSYKLLHTHEGANSHD